MFCLFLLYVENLPIYCQEEYEDSESVNQRTDNTVYKRKKYERTYNDLQNITHKSYIYKTKDQVT